jgi:AcrR family transcriptional regulator
MGADPRPYGGRSHQERRTARRAQLVAAGLDLFGTQGFHATSIRAVLRHSGLAERYFRESFASLEELLVAVYDHVTDEVFARAAAAAAAEGPDLRAQARAGLRGFIEAVTADPRYIRIQLFEVYSAQGVLLDHGFAVMRRFAALIASRTTLDTESATMDPSLVGLGLAGAVHVLLSDWVERGMNTPSVDGLLDHMMLFFDAIIATTTARE